MEEKRLALDAVTECVMLSMVHLVKASRAAVAADQGDNLAHPDNRNPWTRVVHDELHLAMAALGRTGINAPGVGAHVKHIEGPGAFDTENSRSLLKGLEEIFPIAKRVDSERLGSRPEMSIDGPGYDFGKEIFGLIIRLRLEIHGPDGRNSLPDRVGNNGA